MRHGCSARRRRRARLSSRRRPAIRQAMTGFPRYAIYFAAGADSALSRFGAALLGYDAHTGDELPFPRQALDVAPDWRDVTADPRKYGFHGTLKAPMALAPGRTER